ncbi:MAG: hypothetical protein ACP5HM_00660 [Anaerolineae bacterium]
MHWLLTRPSDFSLEVFLKRSECWLLPPFSVYAGRRLERVERLSSGKTLLLSLTQTSAGLHLRSDQRLTAAEAEEVSRKAWRMLRLGENFSEFSRLLSEVPILERCLGRGFRFLRGSTLFEDVVKARVMTHGMERVGAGDDCGFSKEREGWPQGERYLLALVDHLGSALAANPTRHAFPTPTQLSEGADKVRALLGTALGKDVVTIGESFLEAPVTFKELLRRDVPLETTRQALQIFPGMNAAAVALVMLALGRYDYLPFDDLKAETGGRSAQRPECAAAAQPHLRAFFANWQPWAGLVYWLWDWDACLPPDIFEEINFYEQPAG